MKVKGAVSYFSYALENVHLAASNLFLAGSVLTLNSHLQKYVDCCGNFCAQFLVNEINVSFFSLQLDFKKLSHNF